MFLHTPLEKLAKKHFAKGSCGPKQNGSTAVLQDINIERCCIDGGQDEETM